MLWTKKKGCELIKNINQDWCRFRVVGINVAVESNYSNSQSYPIYIASIFINIHFIAILLIRICVSQILKVIIYFGLKQNQNQSNPEAHEEVTINEGQNKVRRRTVRNNKARSPQVGPSILRGASSKKKTLSTQKLSRGR